MRKKKTIKNNKSKGDKNKARRERGCLTEFLSVGHLLLTFQKRPDSSCPVRYQVEAPGKCSASQCLSPWRIRTHMRLLEINSKHSSTVHSSPNSLLNDVMIQNTDKTRT